MDKSGDGNLDAKEVSELLNFLEVQTVDKLDWTPETVKD